MAKDDIVLLRDSVQRLFEAEVTKEQIIAAETGAFTEELWQTVEQQGLTQPHLLADNGLAWNEAYVIVHATGRYAVPLPITETILASWLLSRGGMRSPDGPMTFFPELLSPTTRNQGRLTVDLSRVPWARHARNAVFVLPEETGTRIGYLSLERARFRAGENLAREPRDHVWVDVEPEKTNRCILPWGTVEIYGAMVRCAQMAGALETLLALTVRYAAERIQFGRPLAKFQVIQQEIARMAGHVAAANVAANRAFAAAQHGTFRIKGDVAGAEEPTFEIAAAKVVVGEAAEVVPRIAHQVHGAIGFSYEHELQFYSRRLWSWRAEFGNSSHWADMLGQHAYEIGADGIWPFVTGREDTVPN